MGINTAKYMLSALLLLGSLTAFSIGQPRRHLLPRNIISQRAAKAQRAISYTGEKRQLVVLTSFSDLDFREEEPLPIWDSIFNMPNFTEEPYYGSVHDFFHDQSYGKFDLHFDLHAIKVNNKYATYGSTKNDDANAALLILALADSLKNKVTDWAPYDWDEDGYIDQILVIYAGMGQNDGGDRNTIWPNQASLTIYEHKPVTVSSNGKDFIIDKYGCIPEYGRTTYATFGTICHEFGHCLGLPDIYYDNLSILENWDIMDHGNYSKNGYCPPCYSAFERKQLGWLDIQELTDPTSVTQMPALSDEPVAYLIRNDNYPNEYYILENRQKKGWDQSLPGNGLLIFHIDYDEELWHLGIPNDYRDNHYTIIPANNLSYTTFSYGWAYPYGSKDSLTNNSAPAATLRHAAKDGTMLMSKPITNIKVDDNGLVAFDFMGGELAGLANTQQSTLSRQPSAIYDLRGRIVSGQPATSGIYIVRYADGTIRKKTNVCHY